ncbi:DedA family protein [Plantactinospora sp. S1510]|uniref:DedA family protein n=1 Tax=Plantactinospora alkalitolerans TaxID=2789879 RepID=A0ABS0H2S8_9ACTN|nr:DedA family protein [Plantactinospora alkalitolerans]MBF9132785.1 DedA family protein [Plantactinospora alkalitolerans]
MDGLVDTLAALSGWPALLVVGALAFGESAAFIGLFLPGETALLLGGALAATGHVNLPAMVIVSTVAAIAGDSVGYEIGRWTGDPLRRSRPGRWVGERRWARAEQFIARHGPLAVLLGRWVGVLRTLVPALAGMNRMPYRRFLLFNALGGAAWATTVVLLGYLAGASWRRLEDHVGEAGAGVAALVVTGLVVWWAIRRHRRHRDARR